MMASSKKMPNTKPHYIGRFAPSPTGPLHIGSLYTALASFLDAKSKQGHWLLRIEDLDPPREQAGATKAILHTLQAHGLHWNGDIIYQSLQSRRYEKVIQQLLNAGQAFYCNCSRQQLKSFHGFYSAACHHKQFSDLSNKAIRFKSKNTPIHFNDNIQQQQHSECIPKGTTNDFIIKRRDGLYAYMLAVVIDDIEQDINHIVRGSDILPSTFKQLELYQSLGMPTPHYSHLPIITANDGQKLSKQNLAPAIKNEDSTQNLLNCLQLLQQTPPPQTAHGSVAQILDHAVRHWDIKKVSTQMNINHTDTHQQSTNQ